MVQYENGLGYKNLASPELKHFHCESGVVSRLLQIQSNCFKPDQYTPNSVKLYQIELSNQTQYNPNKFKQIIKCTLNSVKLIIDTSYLHCNK